MAIPLLGIIGWAFIPHQATNQALKVVHYVLLRFFRIPAPAAGTFEYQRNYRYTYAAVVLGYLLYTLIQASNSMQPNYYEILGVSPTADENALKLAFRQFAKKYHPDRVGPQGQALFIRVRDAFDALKNPTVRFAYDRFGPDVLGWKHCSTAGEYLRQGLTQSAGYHVVSVAALVLWTAIGETSPVAFWRYLLYLCLFAFELALLLSPSPSLTPSGLLLGAFQNPKEDAAHRTILHLVFPHRVAYQHILFLHQIFLFMTIALTRVAPQFFPDEAKITEAASHRLLQIVSTTDRDVSQLLHLELHTIQPSEKRIPLTRVQPVLQPSEDAMDVLTKEMEDMIIEGTVRQDGGPFKSAWEAAIEKGKKLAIAAAASVLPSTPIKSFDWSRTSFSPASPLKRMLNGTHSNNGSPAKPIPNSIPMPTVNGSSGRMSPPPPPSLDRPNYVRARSISLV